MAQTRSFASMYLAVTAFCAAAAASPDWLAQLARLPAVGDRLMTEHEPLAKGVGEDLQVDRFYFLGSGARYGLACEASLKMKEMSLTHSEPFHFLEFRHGPISMAGANAVVLGLLSEKNANHEQAVLNEVQALGGKTISIAETAAEVSFSSGLPEAMRGVLYLPFLQLMAYYRAVAKGLNPDCPANLSAVIHLNI